MKICDTHPLSTGSASTELSKQGERNSPKYKGSSYKSEFDCIHSIARPITATEGFYRSEGAFRTVKGVIPTGSSLYETPRQGAEEIVAKFQH